MTTPVYIPIYHKCECGLVFRGMSGWMRHVPHCASFQADSPPLDQVRDCPRYEAIATAQDISRIEALEMAARLSITDSTKFAVKAFGRIHEQIREGVE